MIAMKATRVASVELRHHVVTLYVKYFVRVLSCQFCMNLITDILALN